MDKEKREKIIKVLNQISIDMINDAKNFDGKEFNGKNVATYLAYLGASIKALSEIVKSIIEESL